MKAVTSIMTSLAASAALIATTAVAQNVSQGGRKFTTELTGEAEVTAAGVPNQGDLDGTGSASITDQRRPAARLLGHRRRRYR